MEIRDILDPNDLIGLEEEALRERESRIFEMSLEELLREPDPRVMVVIQHPNMPEPFESVYGCTFEVAVGDAVLCPPAPLWPEPFIGIVTSLQDNGAWTGPVKYLIRRVS
jgi:hypothetical protein